MLPTISLGPLAIPLAPLLVLVGIWLGLLAAERSALRLGLKSDHIDSLVLISLVSGLVGARLAYVLRFPQAFIASPLSLLSRETGLLDPWGGVLVGVIAGLAYAQRRSLPFWPTLDALTSGLAVFAVALGFSHLASGASFGSPTTAPWGILLWGERRQPVQVYEIILAAAILTFILRYGPRFSQRVPGLTFLSFIALTALARLFLEAFRGDSVLLPGGFRSAQVIAWLILALSLTIIYQRLRPRPTGE